MAFTLPWAALPAFLSAYAHAQLSNHTVDDGGADSFTGAMISYSNYTEWNFGPRCVACIAHLDPEKVHNHTWHDATYDGSEDIFSLPQNATFKFTGSALYVYGVISNTVDITGTSNTGISFFIDNESVGQFSHFSDGSNAYKYHVLLYANTSLPHKEHCFKLQNGHIGGSASLILLDYIIYSR
ncbi:hypothetical protein PHLGIDRAFT_201552 [Phlebiopsis gigantea 11061_1 CR5-6]|uniref:Uncharacterized protein n=1 Tax=Phlebiopsis gigantea (strain 11061_1 CR5-6) TaxID=745531 RepID=A0A0C3S6U4_PHLG1|nr:hypothetical protein PHLGIDRAFT_201552 [Phlebiopsis gigantea 11061_1 CR5-6]